MDMGSETRRILLVEVDVLRVDLEHDGDDAQRIGDASRCLCRVDVTRGGVFRDVDKALALVRARAAVQVNGHVVVGQVRIVDAVRVHLLLRRPFTSEGCIDELVANTSGCAIPSELVPTCPECGRPLTPWVYGYEFLEGEHHKQQFEHWNAFLEKNINSKIVFLQVGAGMKNQEYLKLPFWNMTMQHPDAFYVAIEKQAAFAPPEIEDKALTFEGDIAAILHRAASLE